MSQAPVDAGYGARQVLTRQQETVFGQSGAFAQTRPFADPHQQAVATLLSFGHISSRVVVGTVMDSTMLAHCYKVHVERGRAPILAFHGTQSSLSISGARQLNTITPGSSVAVLLHQDNTVGTILCVLPFRATGANRALFDQIHLATRTRVDEMEKRPLKMVGNSNIVDWTSGRPFDSIDNGEVGWISSTGLRVTVDDFMVQLAVNEMCGVTGFYHDMLLRVAGYNQQQWAAGYEREHFDDEGECDDSTHYCPYPWEAFGLFAPGDPRVKLSPETYQLSQPYYFMWEPKSDRQQPFSRDKGYHGYLGQGGRRLLIAPPPTPPEVWQYKPGKEGDASTAYTSGSNGSGKKPADPSYQEVPPIGLHEDNTAMDGRRFISSAKGIIISKRMLHPDATRRKRPDSDDGDNSSNYKASSKFGSGPDHKITGDITTTSNYPALQRATAVLDLHAYLFNYSGLHPFHYHEKDYKTWEQQELQHATHNQTIPNYSELRSSMYLSAPAKKMVKIDHRYGEQEFYQTEAYLSLLEDGGVVLADGAGGEIRMAGGCVTISAPGDVWLKPGRNLQAWTGRDSIFRSKGSIDFSTTEKTIRLKAEKDVMITSGNGGIGGVLIESRATSPQYKFDGIGDDVQLGGVVLRAKNAEVVALAPRMYFRSVGDEKTPAGDITIDCDRGKRNLVVNCHSQLHYMTEGGVYQFFGPENEIEASNMFSKNFTALCSTTGILGTAGVVGHIINKGWILTAEGHIATELAEQFNYFVAPLKGKGLQDVKDWLAEVENIISNTLPEIGNQQYDFNPEELWYAADRPGNQDIIDKIEFSFRSSEQYFVSNDFVVFEDRWQQLARIGNQSPQTWEEKPVKTRVDPENYPFPGKDKFKQSVYLEQDLDLCIYEEGGLRDRKRAKSHDPLETEPKYETPKYREPTKKVLNGNYPIIG